MSKKKSICLYMTRAEARALRAVIGATTRIDVANLMRRFYDERKVEESEISKTNMVIFDFYCRLVDHLSQ